MPFIDVHVSHSVKRFAIVVLLLALVYVGVTGQYNALTFWLQSPWVLGDLVIYREGGQFVIDERALYEGRPFAADRGLSYDYSYPPFGAVIMVPLTWIPVPAMNTLWIAANVAALTVIVAISFSTLINRGATTPKRFVVLIVLVIASVALAPTSETFGHGQISILLAFAPLVDSAVLSPNKNRYAGVLTGIATAVKLLPAAFIAYWITTRQWKPALTSIATTITCWFLAALVTWSNSYEYFINLRFLSLTESIGQETTSAWNQSLFGFLSRNAPTNTWLWWPLALATGIIGLAAAYIAWMRHHDALMSTAIIGMVTVLASPISWITHAIWVIPALGVLLGTGQSFLRTLVTIGIAGLLYSPTRSGWPFPIVEVWFTGFVLLFVALVVLTICQRDTNLSHKNIAISIFPVIKMPSAQSENKEVSRP